MNACRWHDRHARARMRPRRLCQMPACPCALKTYARTHISNTFTRNTGYSVRVNLKVSTTAPASNKQGDVELVNFVFEGSNNLVIDVSICCDHIGNSTVNNGHLNGKMHTNDYLQARAGAKNIKNKEDYAAVGTAFAPAIVSVAGQIHPEFLRLLWVLADKQARNYYALIGAEKEIGTRLSRGVEHARLVLTRTLLARPSLMPLPHAYTPPCTVQFRSRVVKLASPLHRLILTAAARQVCPQSQRVPCLSKNKSGLSAWAGHSEDSAPNARRCTCIASRRPVPCTPSPRCQRGCWCTQRRASCSY